MRGDNMNLEFVKQAQKGAFGSPISTKRKSYENKEVVTEIYKGEPIIATTEQEAKQFVQYLKPSVRRTRNGFRTIKWSDEALSRMSFLSNGGIEYVPTAEFKKYGDKAIPNKYVVKFIPEVHKIITNGINETSTKWIDKSTAVIVKAE